MAGTVKVLVKRQAPGLVGIWIEDDGTGMSKEQQKELLAGEAGGLGLANVLQKIRLIQKADVRLESEPGQGTRIRILLPEENGNESYSS
jgi:sensor histidine kinase YesM